MINLADTEFNGKLTEASIISNPCGAGKKLTREQPVFDFVPTHNGAYDNLKGYHVMNAHFQNALKMIAGKSEGKLNNLTEVFGEDIQENTYASKIAGIAARLDSQVKEEEERTGIRQERLNWSYARNGAENSYVKTEDIGITDERVHSKDVEEMPVEEKADTVTSVQRFNGEMDVVGGRNHFRFNHWLYGESVEVREEKRVLVNRPIMPLAAPIRVGLGKFPIASIEGYDPEYEPVGKVLRMPVFGLFNMTTFKISVSGRGHMEHHARSVKMTGDIEKIKAVLTSEPQFAGEIAEKVGLKPVQVSKILKAALDAGEKIVIGKKMNSSRKMKPVFSI